MINSKLMVGKGAISRLHFEGYFEGCKSVLIISDISSSLSGGARKIKKVFPKEIKVKVVNIKASEVAEFSTVQKCLNAFNECYANMIIAVGTEISHDIGKAVKYLAMTGKSDFATSNENNENSKDFAAENENTANTNEIAVNENKKNINLVCVSVTSGNHHKTLTGSFDIFDRTKNVFYRLNKNIALPTSVVIDTKLLDRLGTIASLGVELGIILMSLIAIANGDSEDKKLSALTALDIVSSGKPLNLEDLILAEMCAGYDFLVIKNNLLDEYVFNAQRITDSKYLLILVLTLQKNISGLVAGLSVEDIKNIGSPYGIGVVADNDSLWRKAFVSVIEEKLKTYFADKDIPKLLSEIGLNSSEIEEVFEELTMNFAGLEILTKLKDVAYSNY